MRRSTALLLGFSLSLNAGLFCGLWHLSTQKKEVQSALDKTILAPSKALSEELSFLFTLSQSELAAELFSKERSEQGYTRADLAASVLYGREHIDVERALGALPLPQWIVLFDKRFALFANLSQESLAALATFLAKERFPYQPKVIFEGIKRKERSFEEAMAFFSKTLPCIDFFHAFHRVDPSFPQKEVLSLLFEVDYETFLTASQLGKREERATEALAELLYIYMQAGSFRAKTLILESFPEWAARYFSNEEVTAILADLSLPEASQERFLKEILTSARPEGITALAKSRLGINLPEKVLEAPKQVERSLAAPPYRTHKVARGDTLWDISRKYRVPLQKVLEINQMAPEQRLKVGSCLKVPAEENKKA